MTTHACFGQTVCKPSNPANQEDEEAMRLWPRLFSSFVHQVTKGDATHFGFMRAGEESGAMKASRANQASREAAWKR